MKKHKNLAQADIDRYNKEHPFLGVVTDIAAAAIVIIIFALIVLVAVLFYGR